MSQHHQHLIVFASMTKNCIFHRYRAANSTPHKIVKHGDEKTIIVLIKYTILPGQLVHKDLLLALKLLHTHKIQDLKVPLLHCPLATVQIFVLDE